MVRYGLKNHQILNKSSVDSETAFAFKKELATINKKLHWDVIRIFSLMYRLFYGNLVRWDAMFCNKATVAYCVFWYTNWEEIFSFIIRLGGAEINTKLTTATAAAVDKTFFRFVHCSSRNRSRLRHSNRERVLCHLLTTINTNTIIFRCHLNRNNYMLFWPSFIIYFTRKCIVGFWINFCFNVKLYIRKYSSFENNLSFRLRDLI